MNIDLLARELTPLHGRRTPKPKDIVVFTSKDEAKFMDHLQGDPNIEERTGLRNYGPLWEKIQSNPELRELFINVSQQVRSGSVPESVQKASLAFDKKLGPFKEEEIGKDPFLDSIEQQGEGEDKKLVKMPPAFSDFLDEYSPAGPGSTQINPRFKIKEYGFWHEALRVIGTIGGALLGGPVGAGIGNTLAHKLTGKSWGKSAMSGLKAGIGTWGVGQLGSAAASAFPGAASSLGSASSNLIGQGATSALGNALTGGSSILGNLMGAGTSAAPTVQTVGQGVAQGTAPAAAPKPEAASIFGNLGDKLGVGNNALPLLLATVGMGAKAHGQSRKDEARYREELRREREENMRLSGFKSPFKQMRFRHERTGYQPTNEEINRGSTGRHFYDPTYENYAGGGMYNPPGKGYVEGRGTGQSDDIDARLSDGEFVIPADVVSSLGDGSNKAGARQLDMLLKNVRKQKISKGTELPPKAMNPMQYMPKHRAGGGVRYA